MSRMDGALVLVAKEVREQPGLLTELVGAHQVVGAAVEPLNRLARARSDRHLLRAVLDVRLDPMQPEVVRVWTDAVKGPAVDRYAALCRGALVLGLLGEPSRAEAFAGEARFIWDAGALGHHVDGLVRGLKDNRDGAFFELGLALRREPLEHVRERIQEALSALSA